MTPDRSIFRSKNIMDNSLPIQYIYIYKRIARFKKVYIFIIVLDEPPKYI